jgi:hypothetical protein
MSEILSKSEYDLVHNMLEKILRVCPEINFTRFRRIFAGVQGSDDNAHKTCVRRS